jgi:ATP synthase protein I
MRIVMPKSDQDTNWGSLAMVGMEVGIGVALGYFVGRWLDGRYGWGSRGAVTGSMIGLAGGLYMLIKQAIAANKD